MGYFFGLVVAQFPALSCQHFCAGFKASLPSDPPFAFESYCLGKANRMLAQNFLGKAD